MSESNVTRSNDMDMERKIQRICGDLVAREVVCYVNETIEMWQKHNPDAYMEAFLKYDWETAAIAEGWEVVEEAPDSDPDANYRKANEGWTEEDLPEDQYEYSSAESWEELCSDENIDADPIDVYEHIAVSRFLAEKLKEKGEVVADVLDFNVWGRTCTGQAIALDSVIRAIARDMEIPPGQKYEWTT